jgi:hypothetical protein
VAIWSRRRDPDPALEEARRRLVEAERDLESARGDNSRVDELASQLHEIRKRNRFAEVMKKALRGSA